MNKLLAIAQENPAITKSLIYGVTTVTVIAEVLFFANKNVGNKDWSLNVNNLTSFSFETHSC